MDVNDGAIVHRLAIDRHSNHFHDEISESESESAGCFTNQRTKTTWVSLPLIEHTQITFSLASIQTDTNKTKNII